jgi:hypothetical protein
MLAGAKMLGHIRDVLNKDVSSATTLRLNELSHMTCIELSLDHRYRNSARRG